MQLEEIKNLSDSRLHLSLSNVTTRSCHPPSWSADLIQTLTGMGVVPMVEVTLFTQQYQLRTPSILLPLGSVIESTTGLLVASQ